MKTESNANPGDPKEIKNSVAERQLLCVRFSPCGEFLFAGAQDATVLRWRIVEEKPIAAAAGATAPDPLSELVDDNAKKVLRPVRAKEAKAAKAANEPPPLELAPLPPLTGFNGWVPDLTFHPTDKVVFAADSWGKLSCTAYEGEALKSKWENPAAHDGWIRRLAISRNGKLLATCGRDRFVRVWNSADGKLVAKHEHTHDIHGVAFAPDGAQIAFGDMLGKLAALDFQAGKIARQFDAQVFYKLDRIQDIGGLRALAFAKDGKTLVAAGTLPKNGATAQGAPLLLYFDFATGKLEQQLTHGDMKDGFVEDLTVHPGGFVMCVSSGTPGNGMVIFHRPNEKTPFYSSGKIANCSSLSLHPGGKRFAVTALKQGKGGGNGRNLVDGEYVGNTSSLHLFEIPA